MTTVPTLWRATYAPGEWIVLSGPTSLVVLQPFAAEWSALIYTLWEEVKSAPSLDTLLDRLAGHGLEEMPHFGAFCWMADGMRSVVRGAVTVIDDTTDQPVAGGGGVQDWRQVGLGHVDHFRIELPTAERQKQLVLPLVVGAVRASRVTLDARPATEESAAMALMENGDTELMVIAPTPSLTPTSDPAPDAEVATARTWPQSASEREPGPEPAQPLVPAISLSDGRTFDLSFPVRIGRAPSADPTSSDSQTLLVVASPHQDVSRTHLQIALRDGQVVATDVHSTNGTTLRRPGSVGAPEHLDPGSAVTVPIGSRLDLGDGVTVMIEPSSSGAS